MLLGKQDVCMGRLALIAAALTEISLSSNTSKIPSPLGSKSGLPGISAATLSSHSNKVLAVIDVGANAVATRVVVAMALKKCNAYMCPVQPPNVCV